jgi:hypothetical protein
MVSKRGLSCAVFALYAVMGVLFFAVPSILRAQSNSGIIQGTVTDPSKRLCRGQSPD